MFRSPQTRTIPMPETTPDLRKAIQQLKSLTWELRQGYTPEKCLELYRAVEACPLPEKDHPIQDLDRIELRHSDGVPAYPQPPYKNPADTSEEEMLQSLAELTQVRLTPAYATALASIIHAQLITRWSQDQALVHGVPYRRMATEAADAIKMILTTARVRNQPSPELKSILDQFRTNPNQTTQPHDQSKLPD